VLEVSGDIKALVIVQFTLPKSTLYSPPTDVRAVRDGDLVTVYWEPVWMTEDDYRGYLIEATVCQEGRLVWIAVAVDGTSYELTDEKTVPAHPAVGYTLLKNTGTPTQWIYLALINLLPHGDDHAKPSMTLPW